jgi:hypothetical protein
MDQLPLFITAALLALIGLGLLGIGIFRSRAKMPVPRA